MKQVIEILHRAAAVASHEPLVGFAAHQLVGDIAHLDAVAFKAEFPRLAGMIKQVVDADARLERERSAGRPLQGWDLEVDVHLEPVGFEVVALVLGDQVADAVAEDAAALTLAKRQARRLGVPHTFCV